jgi:dTDP-4-dehydrorhamnose 3,5-epimerase
MKTINTQVSDVFVVETNKFKDQRGSFSRIFCDQDLSAILGERSIAQINLSQTQAKGAIRGMHFQHPPHAEMKIIRCLKGKVFDVALDLRANSSTFLQWHGEILTANDNKMLVIPEGFAHGFQTLEEDCELLYYHSTHYTPESEGGILFDDPMININWPLACTDASERDRQHKPLEKTYSGIKL